MIKSIAIQLLAGLYDRLRGKRRRVHPIDHALGIETSRRVQRFAIATGSPSDAFSIGYGGAAPSIIRKCLDLIDIDAATDFVDLGCGKGRALVVAAEHPFRSLLGLELSAYLCSIARRNIAKLTPKARYADRIVVLQGDASRPALPETSSVVLFFYNSFRRPLVDTLVAHLESEIAKAPDRKVWFIHYNPVHFELFDRSPAFRQFFAAMFAFEDDEREAAGQAYDSVVIYQSVSGPQIPAMQNARAAVHISIPDLGADVVN